MQDTESRPPHPARLFTDVLIFLIPPPALSSRMAPVWNYPMCGTSSTPRQGKTLQVISLILAQPPAGTDYVKKALAVEANKRLKEALDRGDTPPPQVCLLSLGSSPAIHRARDTTTCTKSRMVVTHVCADIIVSAVCALSRPGLFSRRFERERHGVGGWICCVFVHLAWNRANWLAEETPSVVTYLYRGTHVHSTLVFIIRGPRKEGSPWAFVCDAGNPCL